MKGPAEYTRQGYIEYVQALPPEAQPNLQLAREHQATCVSCAASHVIHQGVMHLRWVFGRAGRTLARMHFFCDRCHADQKVVEDRPKIE